MNLQTNFLASLYLLGFKKTHFAPRVKKKGIYLNYKSIRIAMYPDTVAIYIKNRHRAPTNITDIGFKMQKVIEFIEHYEKRL